MRISSHWCSHGHLCQQARAGVEHEESPIWPENTGQILVRGASKSHSDTRESCGCDLHALQIHSLRCKPTKRKWRQTLTIGGSGCDALELSLLRQCQTKVCSRSLLHEEGGRGCKSLPRPH